MPTRRSFVEPGDRAEVGDEVVFHGDHGNLVRAIVADRALSSLSHVMRYRSSIPGPGPKTLTPASGLATTGYT
jgi:hypothetical protein